MIIRALTTLRAGLLALVILLTISSAQPPVGLAANPYERTDDAEGDPGDGVLDPKSASGGGSWGDPSVAELGVGGGMSDAREERFLVPVVLRDGGGRVAVFLLPCTRWRPLAEVLDRDGRWHDAP